jgi:hypothetical protein
VVTLRRQSRGGRSLNCDPRFELRSAFGGAAAAGTVATPRQMLGGYGQSVDDFTDSDNAIKAFFSYAVASSSWAELPELPTRSEGAAVLMLDSVL